MSNENYKFEPFLHSPTNLPKSKWNCRLTLTTLAMTLGTAVPVGYNIGVINSSLEFILEWCYESWTKYYGSDGSLNFNEVGRLLAIVILTFFVGGCIGSAVGGWFANRFGRRTSLLFCALLFLHAAVVYYSCRYHSILEVFLLARLTAGIASGLATTILPMYLIEIAPTELRGRVAAFTALGVSVGIVAAQIVTLPGMLGTGTQWPLALAAYAVPIIFGFILFPLFPESPKYLFIVAGRRERAQEELQRLRGNDNECVNRELDAMQTEVSHQTADTRTICSVLTDRKLLMPLLIVSALHAGQSFSGIYLFFNVSTSVFEGFEFSVKYAKWMTLFIGLVNLIGTSFGPILMHRFNRRPVILTSCLMIAVGLLQLAIDVAFIHNFTFLLCMIFGIINYVIAFGIGLGPMPYFIAAELFETASRPAAMAIGSFVAWFFNLLIGTILLFFAVYWFTPALLLLFAAICLMLAVFVYHYLPETRGKEAVDVAPMMTEGLRTMRH